ncbi:hypothetical protein [Tateyamaria pelophila]|uniref:hypothetical protein n=1 Tax=Tateyamaria pelophila TaxID=328415 RepID=UPI001CC0106C|nr:hypothetical protein [Tateyamaria pelophila]
MNRISRSVTTIYRTERLIARRRLAVIQNQTILMALAALVAVIGLALFNLCFYLLLSAWLSPAAAAGILGVLNVVLAAVLASSAARMNVEQEIASAVEVRDMAIADLETEIESIGGDMRQVIGVLKSVPKDPFGSLMTVLLPILTALLKKK